MKNSNEQINFKKTTDNTPNRCEPYDVHDSRMSLLKLIKNN